jgi:hypoxanthine phosphoribosyltransferase
MCTIGTSCPHKAAPQALDTTNIAPKSTEPLEDLNVSWLDYYAAANKLANMIREKGIEFEQIICIGRGGFIVGDFLSRETQKPLGVIMAQSRGPNGESGEISLSQHIAFVGNALAKKILLVDDLADSGKTFIAVTEHFQKNYPEVEKLTTACLYKKPGSTYEPDLVAEQLVDERWLNQPFEEKSYRNLTPILA